MASTCFWLASDSSIPVYDAGTHLGFAIDAFEGLRSGRVLKVLTESAPYPPLAYLVGALGIAVGGVGVAPAVLAENLVFVALLALGCYKVARLAWSPLAGTLAVIFALGSPLVIEELHEFMLDAPEAAMVAVSVWAILSTEGFSRLRVCALAGVAVGLGLLTKETFAFFVAGVVLATLVRGGRSGWRGFAAFAAVALVIALPWYLYELSTIHTLGNEALGSSSSVSTPIPGIAPPRLSRANLEWYLWSFANWQLFVPLLAFSAAGALWTAIGLARHRVAGRFVLELWAGALVSWVAITETYVHDPRYSIPMTLYLAVFAAGWVSQLRRPLRGLLAAVLALVALANTMGVGFGVGRPLFVGPSNPTYLQQPGTLTFYANYGLWIGGPSRDGDMPGLLRALRRDGVREVRWFSAKESEIEFSFPGIAVLARIAGLGVPSDAVDPAKVGRSYAFLMHRQPEARLPRPCVVLRDGSGVWVRLGGSGNAWSYCPRPESTGPSG